MGMNTFQVKPESCLTILGVILKIRTQELSVRHFASVIVGESTSLEKAPLMSSRITTKGSNLGRYEIVSQKDQVMRFARLPSYASLPEERGARSFAHP